MKLKMTDAKVFFDEFTKWAPQHTSMVAPLTAGLFCFSILCTIGYRYNEDKLKKKYHDDSPDREPEKAARLIILLIAAIIASFFILNVTYIFIDWPKNKKWYVYKYWFPNMLR